LMLHFGNNEITNIIFYNQAKAKFSPMQKAVDSELRLDGFSWETKRRPTSIEDLFSAKTKIISSTKKDDAKPDTSKPKEGLENQPKPESKPTAKPKQD